MVVCVVQVTEGKEVYIYIYYILFLRKLTHIFYKILITQIQMFCRKFICLFIILFKYKVSLLLHFVALYPS